MQQGLDALTVHLEEGGEPPDVFSGKCPECPENSNTVQVARERSPPPPPGMFFVRLDQPAAGSLENFARPSHAVSAYGRPFRLGSVIYKSTKPGRGAHFVSQTRIGNCWLIFDDLGDGCARPVHHFDHSFAVRNFNPYLVLYDRVEIDNNNEEPRKGISGSGGGASSNASGMKRIRPPRTRVCPPTAKSLLRRRPLAAPTRKRARHGLVRLLKTVSNPRNPTNRGPGASPLWAGGVIVAA